MLTYQFKEWFMKCRVFLVQKDEDLLLEPWIQYYGHMFGFENLFIFDNGSTETPVIDILKTYSDKGVNVDYSYNTPKDFENKGNIVINKMKELSSDSEECFYLPVDCDEFLCLNISDTKFDSLKEDLTSKFQQFYNDTDVIKISKQCFNIYGDELYRPSGTTKNIINKKIFAGDTKYTLDVGYHGLSNTSSLNFKDSEFYYIHFHFKPYQSYLKAAQNKMRLRKMGCGMGVHLEANMKKTEDDYYKSFFNFLPEKSSNDRTSIPFKSYMKSIGINLPF